MPSDHPQQPPINRPPRPPRRRKAADEGGAPKDAPKPPTAKKEFFLPLDDLRGSGLPGDPNLNDPEFQAAQVGAEQVQAQSDSEQKWEIDDNADPEVQRAVEADEAAQPEPTATPAEVEPEAEGVPDAAAQAVSDEESIAEGSETMLDLMKEQNNSLDRVDEAIQVNSGFLQQILEKMNEGGGGGLG